MDNIRKENLIKILESNSLFLNSIKKETKLYLDNNIRIELMFLYLRLNATYLTKIKKPKINAVINLLKNPVYTITENAITFNEVSITGQELISIIEAITQEIQKNKQNKCLFVDFHDVPIYNPHSNTSEKCIYFDAYGISKKRDLVRRRLLSEDHIINSETRKYSRDVEYRFASTLNNLIISILKNDLSEIDYTEILFLYSIMNLLTINDFIGTALPFEATKYDRNLISISCFKYEDSRILLLERKVLAIELNCKTWEAKKQFLVRYCPNSEKLIEDCDKKLHELYQELTLQYLELHELRSEPTKFPRYLLSNIRTCFEENHIELQSSPNDPYVTFFSVNQNSVNCFFEMHLSSFANFINNETLIKTLKSERHIKRFIPNIS